MATETTTADTTTNENGTERKARTRVNPRTKMVKALHSILGEQLRENDYNNAFETGGQILDYLEQLKND